MYESKSNAELRHKLIKAKAITTLAEEESRERNPQAPQHSVINLGGVCFFDFMLKTI